MTTFVDDARREALLYVIRQLSGRGAFAEEEGTAREALIGAQAYAAAWGSTTVARAMAEMIPSLSDELLTEWEIALGLSNDIARTDDERRERIAAVIAASEGSLHAIDEAFARLTWRAAPQLLTNTADDASIGERESIYQTAILIDRDDLTPSAVGDRGHERKSMEAALDRAMPAHALGQLSRGPWMTKTFASARGALWQSATSADGGDGDIGETILDADPPQIGLADTLRYPVRKTSYAQLSRLDAEDLNAIQRDLLWHASKRDGLATRGLNTQGVGGKAYWFNQTVNAGATAIIANIDASDSLVQIFAAGGTSGARQPGDASDGDGGDFTLTSLWYTGTGGATYESEDLGSYVGSRFTFSGGGIGFRNSEASPMEIWGILFISPKLGARAASPTPSDTDILFEYLDGLPGTDFTTVRWSTISEAGLIQKAGGTTADPQAIVTGSLRRLGVVAGITKDATTPKVVVLDTTEDWRDRMIVLGLAIIGDGSEPVRPGIDGDFDFDSAAPVVWYSGPGTSDPTTGYSLSFVSGDLRFFVNPSGHLCAWVSTTIASTSASLLLQVVATEQLGYYTTPASRIVSAVGVIGTRIEPRQLNLPQDCGFYEQMGQGLTLLGAQPPDSECMPLGPINDGLPKVPFSWELDVVSGLAGPIAKRRVRQRLAGAIRIFQSIDCPNASATYVYSGRDLRDRFLMLTVCWSTTDIRPGSAGDTWGTSAPNRYVKTIWTGGQSFLGGDYEIALAANLTLYVTRTPDGVWRWELYNATGSTQYVVLMAEGTPQLGVRS